MPMKPKRKKKRAKTHNQKKLQRLKIAKDVEEEADGEEVNLPKMSLK